jgi:hypothetical protein
MAMQMHCRENHARHAEDNKTKILMKLKIKRSLLSIKIEMEMLKG